jgi:hypothetical protein
VQDIKDISLHFAAAAAATTTTKARACTHTHTHIYLNAEYEEAECQENPLHNPQIFLKSSHILKEDTYYINFIYTEKQQHTHIEDGGHTKYPRFNIASTMEDLRFSEGY